MNSPQELFSVKDEVALNHRTPDHPGASARSPETAETDNYYQSAAYEPAIPVTAHADAYRRMLQEQRGLHSALAVLGMTVAAGIVGGFFAVPGVFLHGNDSVFAILTMVFLGPFAEEILKQSGMIFLLEKRPSVLRGGWQFMLSGALGGAVFSVLENLSDRHVDLSHLQPEALSHVMDFRWKYCTLLHIACTLVSGMGLRRVWLESCRRGLPAQVADAFGWFLTAMAIHGLYNLTALLMNVL